MLKPPANFVLVSLKPCDVPETVRLGFLLAAASLTAGLSILYFSPPGAECCHSAWLIVNPDRQRAADPADVRYAGDGGNT